MPVVQASIQAPAARTGAGTQTVTGVTDQDGTDYTGTVTLFQSAYAAIDTLTAGNVAYPWYADFRGVDTGSVRSAQTVADAYSPFNFKPVSGAVSLGDYSILDQWTDNFGSVHIERVAKIASQSAGSYDILYDANGRTGDNLLSLVLGGSGLDIAFTNSINGTYATPSKPQGLLAFTVPTPAASGATAGGTGGGNVGWGFATRDGVYGTANLNVVNQGSNYIVQRTDAWAATTDVSGTLSAALPTVSAWGDTSFTIANNTGSAISQQVMAICGEDVRCAGGVITQDDTTIETSINPRVVLFFSVGAVSSLTVGSPVGQLITGWATPVSQVGWWSGERTPGNVSPSFGARYLASDSVIRFGTPQGAATTFNSVVAVNDITSDGVITLDWLSSDAGGREILWFAIGEAIPVPPPPPEPIFHTRAVVRRRLRRAPIVWSEKDGLQTRVRINLFAIDMQPGVGTRNTPDPQVMIRASKDGGYTWGNERLVSAGRVGEYFDRLNSWQWGQGRDWVFEVACTDPVTWNLIGAYLDAEGGTS